MNSHVVGLSIMPLDPTHILEGFWAHLIGGVIGGVAGWLVHSVYHRLQRRRHHAEFDREIIGFVAQLKTVISKDKMPGVMARLVPLVSKATYGSEVPPLKEEYSLPSGVTLDCKMCERSIEPTFEGRCPTCKLGASLYHERTE